MQITLWDRVLMHDVGLVNLFAGGRALFCVPAAMATGYGIALLCNLPALVGIMLGALPAFLTCFVVVDKSASRVAARSAALYAPFVLALFASVALRDQRMIALLLIVALLFIQFYAPRFGPWVGDFGGGLFAAYLCGLLLPLPLASFPAMALVFAASLAATILVRSILFHPNAYRSLMRASRAFLGWQTRVLETSIDVLDGDRRALAALHTQRQRSHEAALVAAGLLGGAGTEQSGATAEKLHTLMFDSEQTVDALARLCEELAATAPAEVRDAVSRSIHTVLIDGSAEGNRAARELLAWSDTSAAVAGDQGWLHAVNRTALLLSDLASSSSDWSAIRRQLPAAGDDVPFQSPVVLANGRPLGAASVLDEELAANGMSGPWRHIHVSPALRTAIQAAVAVAIAEPLAIALDGQRFYWGVIGVMVILAGTNSTHDRLRKVASRGIGTVIGGAIGIALVHAIGTEHVWLTLIIVVVALAAGLYGFSRGYVFWVIGLVIALCQVYAYSGQFSDTLILYRLIENIGGALIAVGVSVVVLPVATGAMIRRATLRQLSAVQRFVEEAGALGDDPDGAARLRNASRAVDQATFQLESVFKPLVRFPSGGGYRKDDETRTILVGVARTLRGIASHGERSHPLPAGVADRVSEIIARLARSIGELMSAAEGAGGRLWTSSADLISDLDATLPVGGDALLSYRLHALARIDEALASLAARFGMRVEAGRQVDHTNRQRALSAGRVRHRFPTA